MYSNNLIIQFDCCAKCLVQGLRETRKAFAVFENGEIDAMKPASPYLDSSEAEVPLSPSYRESASVTRIWAISHPDRPTNQT